MNKFIYCALFFLILTGCTKKQGQDKERKDEIINDQETKVTKPYIVTFNSDIFVPVFSEKNGFNSENPDQSKNNLITQVKSYTESIRNLEVRHIYTSFFAGFSADLTEEQVAELSNDTVAIANVYDDIEVQGKPIHQGKPINQGSTQSANWFYDASKKTSCGITRIGGPGLPSANTARIWVIDSGVDNTHPDLNVDTILSKSFVVGSSPYDDDLGHGTHCAGIAAARPSPGSTIGMTGVSPGASIVSMKVLDNCGYGYWSNVAAALNDIAYSVGLNDVIMMSIGEYDVEDCQNFNNSIGNSIKGLTSMPNKQAFVVMSAGNASGNADINFPGCINGNRISTIASMDAKCNNPGYRRFETYSNSNSSGMTEPIDFIAPGTNIFSTFPGNRYAVMSGTSMSCAMVAGIIHHRAGNPHTQTNQRVTGQYGNYFIALLQ